MLGKLLKYEIKATARWFLPMYGLLLVLAAINRLFLGLRDSSMRFDNIFVERFRDLPVILATTVYVFIIAGIFVATTIVIVQRFYKNLMGDEGYLMFTLPVQPWANITSKLLVSMLWIAASVIVTMASLVVVALNSDFLRELPYLFRGFMDTMREIGLSGALSGWLIFANIFAGMVYFVMQIYTSISLGQLSNNHKVIFSFLAYIGINFIIQALSGAISVLLSIQGSAFSSFLFGSYNYDYYDTAEAVLNVFNVSMGIGLLLNVVVIAAMFFVTNRLLTHKLNLE